ncbi:MAG: TonB-dependent receptor [Pseudomonas sp.]|uniref:TonB-dependent receptor n=1 Tax=Pseudomonas sp. TaxID=306 RepID=UPI003D0FCEE9
MKTRLFSFTALSLLVSAPAQAAPSGSSTIVLGEVRVESSSGGSGNGPALPVDSILTSVDVLGSDQIEDKNVMNSWELLGQLPGIQLTETRQGAESGKATFRAFNGEGYINGIKVLIDGIPSNVNSGNQRFIDMIFPLELDYIEVVKGTNDPRYGLHNIGGNINFATRQGGNYNDGRVTYGSFDHREAQIAIGRESDNFAQNYFFAKQDSNGFRDHDESDKFSLGGKWFYTNDPGSLKAGLIARVYHHEADEPGFMTAAELSRSRTHSDLKNRNDGSERDMKQISAHVDYARQDNLVLSNKLYYNHYEDDRKVTFTSYAAGSAPRQRRQWDEVQTGWLSTLTWEANEYLTLDGGVNLEHQDNEYRRFRYAYSVPTDFSSPVLVQNDDDYTLKNIGGYLQAVIQPTESLKIVPAMRVDKFSGHTELVDGTKGSLQDYGWIQQPKLSVVYTINPDLSVYANWGRTFQVLTGSTGPAYLTPGQNRYDPSINTGKEVGIKFAPFDGAEARIAVWQQDATDEVANMPATGTTVGLGETKRRGVDLQITAHVNDELTVWASHAIQEAKVVSAYNASGESLKGNEVFSTPRYISNIGADYQPHHQWRFGIQARAQDDYYIESSNDQGKYGNFLVFDANVKYQLTDTTSVDFQLKNLTDEKYEYVWYDNFFWGGDDQAMFSPAPGRTGYVSVSMKL